MHHVDDTQLSICIYIGRATPLQHWPMPVRKLNSMHHQTLQPIRHASLLKKNLHLAHITADGFARTSCPSSLSSISLFSATLLTLAGLAYGAHK